MKSDRDGSAGKGGAELRLDVPLLRAEDAVQLLSVRRSWIYEAVRLGVLPCLRVGQH